jgi:hypothetical protein
MLASLLLASVLASTNFSAEDVVRRFCEVYVRQDEAVGLLESGGAAALQPFLSKRLLRKAADLRECQRDWGRQQPKGSTDKPPYVDCCLLSGIADGPPDDFSLGTSKRLDDGRVQVNVDYTLRAAGETIRWSDAYIVAQQDKRWVIDDFIGDVASDYPSEPLMQSYTDCRDGKWIGE